MKDKGRLWQHFARAPTVGRVQSRSPSTTPHHHHRPSAARVCLDAFAPPHPQDPDQLGPGSRAPAPLGLGTLGSSPAGAAVGGFLAAVVRHTVADMVSGGRLGPRKGRVL